MIKNMLEVIIVMVVAIVVNFNKKIVLIEEKIAWFNQELDSAFYYYINDGTFLVFDYDYLKSLVNYTFKGYEVSFEKKSEQAFFLTIIIKEKFLYKEISFDIYLKRGDMYGEDY